MTACNLSEESGNIDELVIPLLCNIAACKIQTKEWKKSLEISKQALTLRPDCIKALIRSGSASIKLGEYENAEAFLNKAAKVTSVSDEDVLNKIKSLIVQVHELKNKSRKSYQKQKKTLNNFFTIHSKYDKKITNWGLITKFFNVYLKHILFTLFSAIFFYAVVSNLFILYL